MEGYELECAKVFLENQGGLFKESVASTIEEAIEFLEDSFACIFNTPEEIREYWDENGMDTAGLSAQDIIESLEVLELPDGRYLVIEV